MRQFVSVLCGMVLGIALVSCQAVPRRHPAPKSFHLSPESIPEAEEFESSLEKQGQFIEALFSIDALLEKDFDRAAAREQYAALLAKVRPLVEKAQETGGAHGAALEVMGALRSDGYKYSSEMSGWVSRYGLVSECLRARTGLCLSFTMLTMALLDSCGIESWSVSYPGHVLVRVRKGDRLINLESTHYGDPVVHHYPPELFERAAKEGFIDGRSLDRTQSAWLYLTDRLWAWVLQRSKDYRSFRLLERAEQVLDGSDEVISGQWALRHRLRSLRPANPAAERAESMKLAVDEYERLIRWNPDSGFCYLLLSVAYEDHGDMRASLQVLKRAMGRRNVGTDELDLLLQARWWIKREESGLEEFRLTPEEKRQSDAFLAEHYPFADRAWRLEGTMRRWFEAKER
jgi:hypothetical protein